MKDHHVGDLVVVDTSGDHGRKEPCLIEGQIGEIYAISPNKQNVVVETLGKAWLCHADNLKPLEELL